MSSKKTHVLFAASECEPLCKTGGLADVVGALPKALSQQSVSSSIILPYYCSLPEYIRSKCEKKAEFYITLGWKKQYAGLMHTKYKNRNYYFIDNEEYFDKTELYGYYEDAERFLFFSLAALEAVKYIDEDIDIIHCNDWQTAFIPTALKKLYYNVEGYSKLKTVLTIHNLRFQGTMNTDDFIGMLRLKGDEIWLHEVIHNYQANMLKAGIINADAVTTVSPTYAKEIESAYYGETLNATIKSIDNKLSGILNGIDTSSFNPETDAKIYQNYSDVSGKHKNKKAFFKEFYLNEKDNMLIGMVTRLDRQKGLDLVEYAIHRFMHLNVTFVLLGTGDGLYENTFYKIERAYPKNARCFIMYSDVLARKIYASSDVFLMPSMFEPCGLGQLISMRYGTLPIVRETGGLKDTVLPYNEITGEGTGFSFANYNGDELADTVKRAYDVYSNDRAQFDLMAKRAMEMDFSWKNSAKQYKKLYKSLI